jgi:hypothetical protein
MAKGRNIEAQAVENTAAMEKGVCWFLFYWVPVGETLDDWPAPGWLSNEEQQDRWIDGLCR